MSHYLSTVLTPGHWDPLAPLAGARTALAWKALRFALRALGHLKNEGDPLMTLPAATWRAKPIHEPMKGRPFETIKHEYVAKYLIKAGAIYPMVKWVPQTLELLGTPGELIQAASSLQVLKKTEEPQPSDLMRFEEELCTDLCSLIMESNQREMFQDLNLYLGITYLDFRDILTAVKNMMEALYPVNLDAERVAILMQLEDVIAKARTNNDPSTMLRAIKQRADVSGITQDNREPTSKATDSFAKKNYDQIPAAPSPKMIQDIKNKRSKVNTP